MNPLKKFTIWIVKSLIMLIFATLMLSSVSLDYKNLVAGTFSDVYDYASPASRDKVVEKFADICNQIDKNKVAPDFANLDLWCRDYKSGKLTEKEFFMNVVGILAANDATEKPKLGILDEYNKAIRGINKNKVLSSVLFIILLLILFLLIKDAKAYIITLTGILFSIGLFVMLPFILIHLYNYFIGINTTSIFESIINGNEITPESRDIISVVMLMILRTYSSFVITVSSVFVAVGIAGKIYLFYIKRKMN